jgi:hypothetical protein
LDANKLLSKTLTTASNLKTKIDADDAAHMAAGERFEAAEAHNQAVRKKRLQAKAQDDAEEEDDEFGELRNEDDQDGLQLEDADAPLREIADLAKLRVTAAYEYYAGVLYRDYGSAINGAQGECLGHDRYRNAYRVCETLPGLIVERFEGRRFHVPTQEQLERRSKHRRRLQQVHGVTEPKGFKDNGVWQQDKLVCAPEIYDGDFMLPVSVRVTHEPAWRRCGMMMCVLG